MPEKEFKIIILKKLSEIQENTNNQQNEIKKTIHEQKEKCNEKVKPIKKEQNRTPGASEYND